MQPDKKNAPQNEAVCASDNVVDKAHTEQTRAEKARIGLCLNCAHARKIDSARGSSFYLCALSESDPAFPKYPRLPVIQCSGYSAKV
jgi:hypothetical protein